MTAAEPVIRPAATLILTRSTAAGQAVLMGQRGKSAAFMPSKFVFPGGAVDAEDHARVKTLRFPVATTQLLQRLGPGAMAFPQAALRELTEETGLHLRPGAELRYIFRAITPPRNARRFDAHFFMADAGELLGDADDFSAACDELSALQWIGLAQARQLDLPFITAVVLSEVAHLLAGGAQPGVPFFDNSGPSPQFRRLR